MELILWRHADAEDGAPGQPDAERGLTAKGE
jgi:phosphohistidine phosphatase